MTHKVSLILPDRPAVLSIATVHLTDFYFTDLNCSIGSLAMSEAVWECLYHAGAASRGLRMGPKWPKMKFWIYRKELYGLVRRVNTNTSCVGNFPQVDITPTIAHNSTSGYAKFVQYIPLDCKSTIRFRGWVVQFSPVSLATRVRFPVGALFFSIFLGKPGWSV